MIDKLLDEAVENGLSVSTDNLPKKLKGILIEKDIILDKNLTKAEKKVALTEEIEHFRLNVGNIIDIRKINNKKQELLARSSTYEKLLPYKLIVEAVESGIENVFEFSEYVELPEDFIVEAINYYKQRYRTAEYEKYHIEFEGPLKITKLY